jgi:type IV secretory pathway VirJ component
MQNSWIWIFCLITFYNTKAQTKINISDLPIMTYASVDTSKPIIIYYTGDGGFNSFSTGFAKQFNSKGYPVVSFNCLKSFWKSKTPDQSASEASTLINYYENTWKRKKIILIGYSFGADVLPFIFTRLSKNETDDVRQIVLLSPSNHTDFEVHLTEMLGKSRKGTNNVPAEINKINQVPILIASGEKEEGGINFSALKITNYQKMTIPGGHHYDSDPAEVVNSIIKYLIKSF